MLFQPHTAPEHSKEAGAQTEELVSVDTSPLSVTSGWIDFTFPTTPGAYYWWAIIVYMFYVMSIVCDDYLVPAVDCICEKLHIPDDVAGATLIAFACNGPELLTNTCSIFLTKASVGMGTIVGSAIFNVLVITGSCPIVSPAGKLKVQPHCFLRDAGFSALSIGILWWSLPVIDVFKATVLLGMSIVYVVAVARTSSWFGVADCTGNEGLKESMLCNSTSTSSTSSGITGSINSINGSSQNDVQVSNCESESTSTIVDKDLEMSGKEDPAVLGEFKGSFISRLLSCPTNTLLAMTIPDVKLDHKKHLCWIAFFISMVWLSSTAYVVCMGAQHINKDWGIPQSFLGLTLVAVGTSWPNLMASVITARVGRGAMAVSNALGSNVQNVFFVLAFPIWVRVLLIGPYVMDGSNILSSVIWMGVTLAFCVILTAWNRFSITSNSGWCCIVLYAVYLVQATLSADT